VFGLQVPSWRPKSTTTEEAIKQLDNIAFTDPSKSLIVMFILDCAANYAIDEAGDLIPARNLDGHYHLDGELTIAPREMFKRTLKICLPILKYRPEIKKLVITPMLRYWLDRCCSVVEHIPNFSSEGYEKMIFDGLSTLRRLTKDFLFMHHVQNLRVINPFLVFADESGRGPSAEAIEAVKAFWGPDPVHPSIDCLTIAQAVLLSLHTALGGQ
jgi:hypothetical protein